MHRRNRDGDHVVMMDWSSLHGDWDRDCEVAAAIEEWFEEGDAVRQLEADWDEDVLS